eukprot:CAMPEP_0201697600 /NCGR_PEP_ID=MMETSP0578-20130828/11410_1 /ASSEMBLY_ACC=CAM_ASM_000663 /TAXON_ID=267565 /ORGANISM="Skeletonema grethea, Strain CCMP 1804" /LENGTH=137 /DNA_ID=CAMNT_0048183803 /DNA_START=41 /DNA_END=451 /DNA_ORIENTATION=-
MPQSYGSLPTEEPEPGVDVLPVSEDVDIFTKIKWTVMGSKSAIIASLGVIVVASFALAGSSSPDPKRLPLLGKSPHVLWSRWKYFGPWFNADAEHWPPSLHTLFNFAPPYPVTTAAASEAGWVKIDEPCNPLLGEAW